MLSLFSLEGKTALVTGARSGIGQAIAQGLAGAGADLILLGHQDNLAETEELVKEAGREVEVVLADLGNREQLAAVISPLLARRRVDILVNNAGMTWRGPALDFPAEEWDRVLQVNLSGVFTLTRLVARPMLERGAGKIINIASITSFQGGLNIAAYTASKSGLAGLTRALANEWAARGVQVNAIAPGYIQTNLTRALTQDEERNRAISSRIPAGRWGQPQDLIGAAIFLASPASDYVNGHLLAVDGGWLAW